MNKRTKIIIGLGVILFISTITYQIKTYSTSTLNSNTKKEIIKHDVPFTTQSPFAEWSDVRQEDGCEEASALMAVYWAKGITSIDPELAKKEIIAASEWQLEKYGNFRDTSVADTAKRIIKGYFKYTDISIKNNITINDIIIALEKDNIVILAANGRALGNQYFVSPGPERHMLVITGYDYQKMEFITNDPGTRNGKDFRYSKDVLENAIRDYPSDNGQTQEPIVGVQRNMIVVSK